MSNYDAAAIRAEFPMLQTKVNGYPLIYLDSAATAQRPESVIVAESEYSRLANAPVARGSASLSALATMQVEQIRAKAAEFIGANRTEEVIWTKSATEGLNAIAYAILNCSLATSELQEKYGLQPGDNVVLTPLEHHANLLPWQRLCQQTGAEIRFLSTTIDGRVDTTAASLAQIDSRTKWVSVSGASNVTGAITLLEPILKAAKTARKGEGAWVVVDACQLAAHRPLRLADTGVHFAALSAHKIYGPTGLGILWGRYDLLAELPPFICGGSMVEVVNLHDATFLPPPARHEAGTQANTQIMGFGKTLDFMAKVGWDYIYEHGQNLGQMLLKGLRELPEVRILGPIEMENRLALVSFEVDGVHPHDVGQIIDARGIAVRTGHQCAQPAHRLFNVHTSTRASVGVYTDEQDVERFLEVLPTVWKFFQSGQLS